jgi:hypothetical protein
MQERAKGNPFGLRHMPKWAATSFVFFFVVNHFVFTSNSTSVTVAANWNLLYLLFMFTR